MQSPADRAERIADLVESALELQSTERTEFLERECGGDLELRAEIDSLLKFQPQAESFISGPAYEMAAEAFAETTELPAGHELGNYRIQSLLGEGGMGEVYLAEDLQLQRAVAIKLIKRAFTRSSFLRQFQQEERILAGLTHPNIARLYGGGVTRDGLPYFVMEYVDGERLDDYCARHQLTLPGRLEIFRKICAAVSYAHQHLVIHRDLKPGNLRVTEEGEPKLLDFGIAKLLNEAAETPEQTISLQSVMTPDYASPEQVRGDRMTTASDVYSLGVILYELLAGAKPFRLTSRRPEEISRAITETIPAPPSAAPSAHPKSLRGDLDNIVLMALRKEPERRYASVAQFAEDIRRHLAGLPVIARKDTLGYRSAKFIRRHKFAAGAIAVVGATLVTGILTTSWEARRAEEQRARAQHRFDELRSLARSLLFEIHDSVADLPGSTATRQLIITRALEYLHSLAEEAGGDSSLLREVAAAYLRVGNVQGNPSNANLGDTSGALESYEKAARISEQLLIFDQQDAIAQRQLAVVEEKICDVQALRGEIAEAIRHQLRSLALFQTLAQKNPQDAAAQRSFAISEFKTGDVLGNPNFPNNGDTDGAMQHYHAALAKLESLLPTEDVRTQRMLGVVEERLGTMLEEAREIDQAGAHYRASARIRLQLAEEHPDNYDIMRDAAVAYEKIANVESASGDLASALASRQRSLQIFQQLANADPKNVVAAQSLGISYMHLAELFGATNLPNLNRPQEAIANYERALELLTRASERPDQKLHGFIETIGQELEALKNRPPK